jgi:hypothetical protein
VNTTDVPGNFDESGLRATLKFCSPATYAAARHFLRTRDTARLPVIITGMVERYVEGRLQSRLQMGSHALRLREDLGLDSLSMMEFVVLADEVLQVTLSDAELSDLRTLGDVQSVFHRKLVPAGVPIAMASQSTESSRALVDSSQPVEYGA